jgi:predicted secreted acid phosphatase
MINEHWATEMNKVICKAIHIVSNSDITDNPGVIFDIDNTLFDNDGNVIEQTLLFYKYLKMKNVNIFFITSRPGIEEGIKYTIDQLDSIGITKNQYESMYFIKPNKTDVFKFKLDARYSIFKRGFNIILSIGDNLSDIGEYGGEGILVPVKQS